MSGEKSDEKSRRRKRLGEIAQAYRAAHELLSAAISVVLMVVAGYWLDKRLNWVPLLTISGACLGFIIAGFSVKALVQRLDRETAARKKQQSSGGE